MKTSNQNNEDLQDENTTEEGIVLPAVMWWLGVPISLLLVLWLIGIF